MKGDSAEPCSPELRSSCAAWILLQTRLLHAHWELGASGSRADLWHCCASLDQRSSPMCRW